MEKPNKLLLCAHYNHGNYSDLTQIKAHLQTMAPELKVKVISGKMNLLQRLRYKNATLISMVAWKYTPPEGCNMYTGKNLTKSEECQILDDNDIPVPRWHLWKEGSALPSQIDKWGDYVVRKPNIGSRGAEIKIVKRSCLKWKTLDVKYRGVSSEPFLQEYIHTGSQPVSYRVGTFFGNPLYSFKIEAPRNPNFTSSTDKYDTIKNQGGARIVANSKKSIYTNCFDQDILDLARRAHGAFPNIPLLGVDIIQDQQTGKLWVIEVNASGYTWHLSSEVGRIVQEKNQIDLYSQFGGLEHAATIIAKRFGFQ